jgi:hypothetical protein
MMNMITNLIAAFVCVFSNDFDRLLNKTQRVSPVLLFVPG